MEDQSAISRKDCDKTLYPLAYFFGAWLGDGSFRYNVMTRCYQICFVSADQEIVERFIKDAMSTFYDLKVPYMATEITKSGTTIWRVAFCSKLFTEMICFLTGCKTHLPDFIWDAPKQVQLELLSGLMDTDGSIIRQSNAQCRKGYFYLLKFTGTKYFVHQFPDLCRVLGIKLTGYSVENHSNPKHAQRHLYSISLPSAVANGFKFWCKRKQERLEESIASAKTRYQSVSPETTRLAALMQKI